MKEEMNNRYYAARGFRAIKAFSPTILILQVEVRAVSIGGGRLFPASAAS
ncbi:hypothetical protein [Lacticaseibacillus nasuensis]|nr:hypothetical protein [Lacticaseibacillus nasuensis]